MERYKELLKQRGFQVKDVPEIPVYYAGNLTDEQKEKGFLTRYFVYNKISRKLTEVSSVTYNQVSRSINANHLTFTYAFSIFTLLWRVKEHQGTVPVRVYNETAVSAVAGQYPEILSYITDFEQFKID